ncbi:MAG: hypothetical protein QM729_00475 [Solirubrobacterales bacterium]
MQGFWWKLPLLRRVSPMRKGAIPAVAGAIVISVCTYAVLSYFSTSPSPELAGDLAQIGATLLVAYGVEVSWLVKASRARGADRENWIGFVAALAFCGLLGIGVALGLSGLHGSMTWFERCLFAWSVSTLGLLGAFVALSPAISYDWSHALRAEYSDE